MAFLDGEQARSSSGPSARQDGSGMKRFVHVSEGSLHLAEIFAILHFQADSQPPREAAREPTSLPNQSRGLGEAPQANPGQGGAPLPPCGLDLQHHPTQHPVFMSITTPKTTAIDTSPAFAQPYHSQWPFPLRLVSIPSCWVLVLQNLDIRSPASPQCT